MDPSSDQVIWGSVKSPTIGNSCRMRQSPSEPAGLDGGHRSMQKPTGELREYSVGATTLSKRHSGNHRSNSSDSAARPRLVNLPLYPTASNEHLVNSEHVVFSTPSSSSEKTSSKGHSGNHRSDSSDSAARPGIVDDPLYPTASNEHLVNSEHVLFSTPSSNSEKTSSENAPMHARGETIQDTFSDAEKDATRMRTQLGRYQSCTGPCLFVNTPTGCRRGIACGFCHLQHQHGRKIRPCKGKRDRLRKLISRLQQHAEKDTAEQSDDFDRGNECDPEGRRRLVDL